MRRCVIEDAGDASCAETGVNVVLFPELLYRMAWILYVCASLFVGEVVGGR